LRVFIANARAGRAEEKFAKLEVCVEGGAEAAGETGRRVARRFLTGWPGNVVFTTFITHQFSRGPWTSAVQGPKFFKLFIWLQAVGLERVATKIWF